MQDSLKEWALWYAGMGLSVFPLKPGSKAPATANGFKDATTDKAQIERWWGGCPDSNIGIATGVEYGGLVVVDLDRNHRPGEDGHETLKDWQRENGGELPETWMSITGQGGYHLIYEDDEPHGSRKGLYKGVDVKGEGGYIVAPPSVHPNGHRYEWEQGPGECEIARADSRVRGFLLGPMPEGGQAFSLPETIPEGGRTDAMVRLIGLLKRGGLDDEAIRAAVRAENEAKCVPPLTDSELEKTVFPALTRGWKAERPYTGQGIQIQGMDLLDFQKINKNGTPYDILDNKIAEYITQERLKMFVLNGRPYLYRHGVYKRDEDGKILRSNIKTMIWPDLVTINRINRVYSLILVDHRLSKNSDEVNQYPAQWINFKNGMYDPVSGQMHEHDPKYCSINQVPHIYDPEAIYRGSVAEKFYEGLIPDAADREMFFAYCGNCMNIDTRLQKFMVILGYPGSGKSTAINMLVNAVGRENVSSITLRDLNERFMPTELLGKLLNACADLPKKALDQVDAIKRITGEDLVKGEYKGGKIFAFYSYAKLIFSANEMPISLDEKSGAFFRRLLMIEVTKKGPRIQGLKEGLEESMPGFIRECVDALSRMYARGGEVDSPHSKELVHEFHRESDSVQAFLDDCIERRAGERIERGELYRRYSDYCWTNGWTALGNRSLFKNLRGKGYRDYQAADHSRYFKDMRCTITDNLRATTDFHPATQEE